MNFWGKNTELLRAQQPGTYGLSSLLAARFLGALALLAVHLQRAHAALRLQGARLRPAQVAGVPGRGARHRWSVGQRSRRPASGPELRRRLVTANV